MNDRSFYKKAKYNKTIEMTDVQLSELKKVLLDILKDFICLADKEGIRYVLCGGSCLGAVRHHGFIPWDDDIDLLLSRKDYNKFVKIFNERLGEKYVLCAPEIGHKHGMSHTQMKKKGTVYQSFNELSKTNDDQMGIYIDIFVMEDTFDTGVFRKLHGIACLAAGYMLTCRKTYDDYPYLRSYIKNDKKLRAAFLKKAKIGRFFKCIDIDDAARFTAKVYSLCKNGNSEYISVPSGREHYFGATYKRDILFNRKAVYFEGIKVWIPKGYDEYLSHLYGYDYMDIPKGGHESHPIMRLSFGK